ncbi:hypothetical protein NDU88_002382 [Pleurodeles waltl]|uniref:Uncharacterized protein n=1 Tax=Pleurodeles waltl TaxID=8319 RepID=A0AAV7MR95_PLEWA|nr:hypothetical protein NDU88_002382 [Pleurodeles waltl]
MVEEIVRVEPQLFGSQVQHTSIARKMELWRKNRGQGKRSGTAPKKSGGHQEEVERPTGEGAFRGLKIPPGGSADWRPTRTSSSTSNNMGGAVPGDSAS